MIDIEVQTVLLDMGGVILHMAGGRGFPDSRLDWRGRQALVQTIRAAGGRVALDHLEAVVFGPWRREHGRREESGVEADWRPHLDKLRVQSRCQIDDLGLLATWFGPYGERLVPFAGTAKALTAIDDADLKLAVVSNVPLPGELYLRVLERHGLARYFDHLVFSYDAGSRKPSPAMLRQAMAAVGAEPDSTVMVGDRRDRDIAAGRFAGTATVWIRSEDGGGPEPHATIDSLVELPGLLGLGQG